MPKKKPDLERGRAFLFLRAGAELPAQEASMKRALTLGLAVGFIAGAASAQDAYPSKAVRIIVPFAAAGPTYTVASVVGAKLADLLAQPFVVENRAGAGGNIGA